MRVQPAGLTRTPTRSFLKYPKIPSWLIRQSLSASGHFSENVRSPQGRHLIGTRLLLDARLVALSLQNSVRCSEAACTGGVVVRPSMASDCARLRAFARPIIAPRRSYSAHLH